MAHDVDKAALRTPRLLLRSWRPSDREPFAAMNADPEVMRYFVTPLTKSESDAFAARIEAGMAADGFGLWAVELCAGPAFIGFAGIWRLPAKNPHAGKVEVGWRLDRSAWGNGYATEAARAAMTYGFEVVGLREIVSMTAAVNAPSRAVMERLGMTRDIADDFDHPAVPVGHPLRRHVLYRIRAVRSHPSHPPSSGAKRG